MKLFFALWPSDACRKQVDQFNQALPATELKKVKPDNLHVTLIYLGNVDAPIETLIRQEVDKIKVKSFTLHFEQLVFWQVPRILCLVTPHSEPALLRLVNALKNVVDSYGITLEDRPYIPHIT